MPINPIEAPTSVMQSTQSITDANAIASQSTIIIGLMQGLCSLLMIVGLIVGIIYMIKSKKTKGKRILIGVMIIVVPFILNWILSIVKVNMLLSM